ncbi:hypothetical protein [Holospora curviuscula]|uniref:Uncharacterized protein n=1 Tax=Holospora curviuscula TaxID=1082868 RepID=A0A2S5R7K5_9PROT|nr:hypothetical protein [Holospora curviuscula]PPE03294.1 hypothetical protein HCUR_01249 [Holospora curviuscula]
MKKNSFNILCFALSLGIIIPSQGWSEGTEVADPSQQPTAAPMPSQPPAAPDQAPEAQDKASAPSLDAAGVAPGAEKPPGEAASPSGAAATPEPEAGAEKPSSEEGKKTKSKKKRKSKGKGRGKHGTSTHACPPPADVISQLNSRNNVEPADSMCNPKGSTNESLGEATSTMPR